MNADNCERLVGIIRFAVAVATWRGSANILLSAKTVVESEKGRAADTVEEEKRVVQQFLETVHRPEGFLSFLPQFEALTSKLKQETVRRHSELLVSHDEADHLFGDIRPEQFSHENRREFHKPVVDLLIEDMLGPFDKSAADYDSLFNIYENWFVAHYYYMEGWRSLLNKGIRQGRKPKKGDQKDLTRLVYLKHCDYLVSDDGPFRSLMNDTQNPELLGRLISLEEFEQNLVDQSLEPRKRNPEDVYATGD